MATKKATKKATTAEPHQLPKAGDLVYVRAMRNGPRIVDESARVVTVHLPKVDTDTGEVTPAKLDLDVLDKAGKVLRHVEGITRGDQHRVANTWVPHPLHAPSEPEPEPQPEPEGK